MTRGLFQSRWAPGFPGRWPCRKAKGREGSLSNPAGPGPGRDRAWVGSRHHPKALEPTLVRSRRSGSSGHLPRCLYSGQVRTQSTERKHCTNPAEWSARAEGTRWPAEGRANPGRPGTLQRPFLLPGPGPAGLRLSSPKCQTGHLFRPVGLGGACFTGTRPGRLPGTGPLLLPLL